MPLTHIHLAAGKSLADRTAILDAIHAALVDALRIPAGDRNQILHEHAPEHFRAHRGADSVFIEITLFAGRSGAAKRALYAALVEQLGQVGVRAAAITTVLRDVPREDWGIRGGQSAADVELGFVVEV
jgi:phenylpyruvate tautomerase PptA (4-oxalocrotonate tautomerase family)